MSPRIITARAAPTGAISAGTGKAGALQFFTARAQFSSSTLYCISPLQSDPQMSSSTKILERKTTPALQNKLYRTWLVQECKAFRAILKLYFPGYDPVRVPTTFVYPARIPVAWTSLPFRMNSAVSFSQPFVRISLTQRGLVRENVGDLVSQTSGQATSHEEGSLVRSGRAAFQTKSGHLLHAARRRLHQIKTNRGTRVRGTHVINVVVGCKIKAPPPHLG
jgi:hypothetical protein